MEVKKFKDSKIYQKIFDFMRMGNKSVQLAIAENKRKGLPSVFSLNDTIYYSMPDGSMTKKSPFKKSKRK